MTATLAPNPAEVAPSRAMNANDVRNLRLLAGWTQTQLGQVLGMSKRAYLRRETGQQDFRVPELLMLTLWWRQLRAQGLKVLVMDDPRHGQWWVCGQQDGKRWNALGPFETRREAERIVRWLEEEGL
jgi:transcriptional regulator with XRE-family HTH domain